MANDLVAYSRAGDAFHYRWAARRCLRLIYPNSPVTKIHVEGSGEEQKAGEYVIDVSEYGFNKDGKATIDYYQLKHTTVQGHKPFTLSDFKDTFAGFAKRFKQHKKDIDDKQVLISFVIVTNRSFSDSFKKNLQSLRENKSANSSFDNTIKNYTKLNTKQLSEFCSILQIQDSEGNYEVQKNELRAELTQLSAGLVENAAIENVVALVVDKILPRSDGFINREEILKRFGVTSERQLYPAVAIWDEHANIIEREQYKTLASAITNSKNPVVVHAAGGVGKSVFCRHLVNELPYHSFGVVYDCFGMGQYRNRSETRHSHKDAFVQIINELASQGLCDPLLPSNHSDKDFMRKFLEQIETSVKTLKKVSNSAKLYIVIDAADNAEMAANEYNESCFVHELIREKLPDDCKLVMSCRTERRDLLQIPGNVSQLEIESFSANETHLNLKNFFPTATEDDGLEFQRLTSGNPRVQAITLDQNPKTLSELLIGLGPGTTVQQQIEMQLNSAIEKIKDQISPTQFEQIKNICIGLASLPPHIPLEALAQIARVSVDHIKSFVSDFGRSLWLTETSVQFRDEPTETWFRETFLASKDIYRSYIEILEPIANQSTYIAEVLPQLYLQAEQYDKLIEIALSDNYLPVNSPIDARNIRVFRLQFALKAALRQKNYTDTIKLAIRAGEESAGNQRQMNLFINNIDLLTELQSKEKIQEIAFKRELAGNWDGSENVYSASLLSCISDYRSEARGYLRAADNWLHLYFDEQKDVEDFHRNDKVEDSDILEIIFAYLNIYGIEGCNKIIRSFRTGPAVARIVLSLANRLIDGSRFEDLSKLINVLSDKPLYLISLVSPLLEIGQFPDKKHLGTTLNLLATGNVEDIDFNQAYNSHIPNAVISFLEICLHHGLSKAKISKVLNHYIPRKAAQSVYSSYNSYDRDIYLKALAIRTLLSKSDTIDLSTIAPSHFKLQKKKYELNNDAREFEQVINGLFPWYYLRVKIISNIKINLIEESKVSDNLSQKARNSRYRNHDTLPSEITEIWTSIFILFIKWDKSLSVKFYKNFLKEDKNFTIDRQIKLLRAIYRFGEIDDIINLEHSTYQLIKGSDQGPDEMARNYISLARAVLASNVDDSSLYFDEAVRIVSKFGDEILQRWGAIVSLAKRISDDTANIDQKLSYRFIRCAELVGENSREKHWDRDEAIEVCTAMSPGIGVSTLSRWRDRDIGWFSQQMHSLIVYLIKKKHITPSVGWSLGYLSYNSHKLLLICIEKEPDKQIRQVILEDAVELYKKEGLDQWSEIEELCLKFTLKTDSIKSVISQSDEDKKKQSNVDTSKNKFKEKQQKEWNKIFRGLDISSANDLNVLFERLYVAENKKVNGLSSFNLMAEFAQRLTLPLFWKFIDTALTLDHFNSYDLEHILSEIPNEWKNKVSFTSKLSNFINKFGRKFAQELAEEYSFKYTVKRLNLNDELTEQLRSAVLEGLSENKILANSGMFFGVVNLATSLIKSVNATELLDYALARFELHIDKDFGEGEWTESLKVSDDFDHILSGMIWSALGSPRAKTRWKAAHCIKKIGQLNCTNFLDKLVDWMKVDAVDVFGYRQYPFYNLHARMYLMIAFLRLSTERPDLLLKYNSAFINYALKHKHILIQKFAGDIIINIETAFPKTFKKENIEEIKKIRAGKGSKSPEQVKRKSQKNRGRSRSSKFHFAYDFDRYWFEPLGDIFDLSGDEVELLAEKIIVKDWNLGDRNGYNDDPRVNLWRNNSERETYYYKSDYPRTDNFDFYRSYHSMLVVAAELFETKLIIDYGSDYEDRWNDWLMRHSLSRSDGRWVSDSRSPLPVKRPLWIFQERTKTWEDDIIDVDFLNCIQNSDTSINVEGGWHEKKDERIERVSISSALVSTSTSNALLRALATCKDPHDYKLPTYGDKNMEFESDSFNLEGWINEYYDHRILDQHDPYADNISYPLFDFGSNIVDKFKLTCDRDQNVWYEQGKLKNPVANSESWSSPNNERDEEPQQCGKRMKISLSFLKHICNILDRNIIFKVSIGREISRRYRNDDTDYKDSKYKVFIFSKDGQLKGMEKSYRLG